VRDCVRAFDGNGADRPRDGGSLLVEVLRLDLRGGLVEDVFWEGLQERDDSVPPGEESGRAHAVRLSAGLLLLQIGLPSAGDPGRAERATRPTAVPRSVPPMPARPSNVVESIRALPRTALNNR